MKKYLLLILLTAFLVVPISYASCDNVTLSVTEPQNLTYTTSINLPFDYVAVNASSCWIYVATGSKWYDNITLECSQTSRDFDVDYDGNYTYEVWAVNTSAADDCNVTGEFTVDRTSEFEEAKPIVMMLIITMLVVFGLILIAFGKVFKKKYQFIVNACSFMFVYSAFGLLLLAAREYIKIPSVYDTLARVYWATMIIFLLFISVFTVLFVVGWIKKNYDKLRKIKFGGLS